MGVRKRSTVWTYFDEMDNGSNKVLCRVCSESVQRSDNTSNMLKHLRSKHPVEFNHVEELRKMQASQPKEKKESKKKGKHSENGCENKQTSINHAQIKGQEVKVQYGDQEMSFMMPYLKTDEHRGVQVRAGNHQRGTEVGSSNVMHAVELEVQASHSKLGYNQSHATEYSLVDSNGNDAITSAGVGETLFLARKRKLENEWMDLFHESIRPHLREMDKYQQRQYISRVSQAVMEILNGGESSSGCTAKETTKIDVQDKEKDASSCILLEPSPENSTINDG